MGAKLFHGISNGDAALIKRVADVGEASVATCVIVRGELMDMAYRSERISSNLARVQTFLQDIGMYILEERTADIYGLLKADLVRRYGPKEKNKRRHVRIDHLGIGEGDLWIASIALQHDLTVVSADSDFARIQQVRALNVENWMTPKTAETNSP